MSGEESAKKNKTQKNVFYVNLEISRYFALFDRDGQYSDMVRGFLLDLGISSLIRLYSEAGQ